MTKTIELKAAEWIENSIKDHIDEPDESSWNNLSEKPTLYIKKRNLKISFPKVLFDNCAEENTVRSTVKERLEIIVHDIKSRNYKNILISLNEQHGWSIT